MKFCRDCVHCFTGLEKYDIEIKFQEDKPTLLPEGVIEIFQQAQCLVAKDWRCKASGRFPTCLEMRMNELACGGIARWFEAK